MDMHRNKNVLAKHATEGWVGIMVARWKKQRLGWHRLQQFHAPVALIFSLTHVFAILAGLPHKQKKREAKKKNGPQDLPVTEPAFK
eukprot:scaffold154889_cov9-Tisochrysis_lutea.AAC.1